MLAPALAKLKKYDLHDAVLHATSRYPSGQNNTSLALITKAMVRTICAETRVNDQFEDWEPNEKQDTRLILANGVEFGAALCFFAIVIGAFHEGETGMRCGAMPMPRLPRNCKRLSRSNQALDLSGKADQRRPRARSRPLTGINSFRRRSTEGALWVCELCCQFGSNCCFGMLSWLRARAIKSRPDPCGGQFGPTAQPSGKFADRPARPAER